jgi:hypothetical protein
MKSKVLASCLFLLIIFPSSCKKDSFPGIVGQWISVAVYREWQTGNFEWIPTDDRSRFFYSFYPDGRFGSWCDVPSGGGTYSYNRSTGDLQLNFEADIYGGTAETITLKVEKTDQGRLIIAHFSNTGTLYAKTEYTKY